MERESLGLSPTNHGTLVLLLIGLNLIIEAFDVHVPKGYIYFAMGFSVFVELLNLRLRKKSSPVHLHDRYAPDSGKQN